MWSSRWNDWQPKPKYLLKTYRSAALSTTNPTFPDPGSNPGRGGKPETNRLSYGTADIINIRTMKDWFILKMTVAGSSETLIPTY
jgi:hypothetical protein